MKKINRYVLIGITSLILICSFLIPMSKAQEWTYNGVDTEPIPGFFVYPSERYYYNFTLSGLIPPESYMRLDIVKGNFTDEFGGSSTYLDYPPLVGGSCIWGDIYMGNSTSGIEELDSTNFQFVYWNETVGLISMGNFLIPVDEFGEVTAQSLEAVLEASQSDIDSMPGVGRFEHNASYPNIYSCELWNSTYNNVFYKLNFTENGHQINSETFGIPNVGNITLISRPAQLAPVFSFTTDTGELELDTTDLTLNMTITDADNNNDQEPDMDYLYRIHNGTGWTDWAAPTSQIDCEIADTTAGDYDILIEVKNMYGTTQEQITITYTPPGGDGDIIPSYPIAIISLVAIFSVSLIILKQRKKLRL